MYSSGLLVHAQSHIITLIFKMPSTSVIPRGLPPVPSHKLVVFFDAEFYVIFVYFGQIFCKCFLPFGR